MVEKKWNEVKSGTKIHLSNDTCFNGLTKYKYLKAGYYYIVGFWANACGLNSKKDWQGNGFAEHFILSRGLTKFDNIID